MLLDYVTIWTKWISICCSSKMTWIFFFSCSTSHLCWQFTICSSFAAPHISLFSWNDNYSKTRQHSSFLFLALFNILSLYLAMGCKVRNNTGDESSVYRSLLSNRLHQHTDVKGLLSQMTEHVRVLHSKKKYVLEKVSQQRFYQSVSLRLEWDVGKHYQ